jgi:hypothetical protein
VPDTPQEKPVLRVIRGDATPEEIAALVATLMAQTARAGAPSAPPHRSAWADRSRLLRHPIRPAPGAWRRSALPS